MKRFLALAAIAAAFAFPGQGKAQYITSTVNGQTVVTRDPSLWPFTSDSPWNTPIGSGAIYASPTDPMTVDLRGTDAWLNIRIWSHPIYQARSTDPMIQILDNENNRIFTVNVPVGATPDPSSDAHMYVIDPTKQFVTEMFQAKINTNQTITTKRAFQVSLYGKGWFNSDSSYDGTHNQFGVRATNSSGVGGILRVWEVQQLSIHHALTYLLSVAQLKHGPLWPSSREDFYGYSLYTGHVPIGQLAAIPPSVDVTKLNLSPIGLAMAHALQDYGAYCDDSSGDTLLHVSVEPAVYYNVPSATITDMQNAIKKLRNYLVPVLNNSPTTPGGGGTPRQPSAPPLAAQPIQ